jgi:hypothetical protein
MCASNYTLYGVSAEQRQMVNDERRSEETP